MTKEYGQPDADTAAYRLLLQTIEGLQAIRILHHPRKPLNAKPCQLPGSLLVQAVMLDGTVVSVRQAKVGATPRVIK